MNDNSEIECFVPLLGGGGDNMEPAFRAFVMHKLYNKTICRSCYATNSIKAKCCRKRKCGKSNNLRPKKVLKK